MSAYDAQRVSAFFDDYGESEWTRFDDGRTPPASLEEHLLFLRRFAHAGDVVLDAGCGPGRFSIELARLGAEIVAVDVSQVQIDLHRDRLTAAGFEHAVRERHLLDVTDLSRFADNTFDLVVCFGGPISYAVGQAEIALAELARVTRPRGHLVVSVMSSVGTAIHFVHQAVELARRDGVEVMEEIFRTGVLPGGNGYGHLPMKLFRWSELEPLLARHGRVVAVSAAGLLPVVRPVEPELQALLQRLDVELAAEPGAIACGQHLIAAVEIA